MENANAMSMLYTHTKALKTDITLYNIILCAITLDLEEELIKEN
jgi:hypothetical protein